MITEKNENMKILITIALYGTVIVNLFYYDHIQIIFIILHKLINVKIGQSRDKAT